MEEGALKDFVITPRILFRMQESGEIKFSELVVYQWLCRLADIYGYAHVPSYDYLAALIPLGLKPNTLGVIMRSLRNHGLIDYPDHKGGRSGFRVTIGFWPLGGGRCRTLKIFTQRHGHLFSSSEEAPQSQVKEEVGTMNHRSFSKKYGSTYTKMSKSKDEQITGSYIEKERKTKIDYMSNTTDRNKCIPVSKFIPESQEQEKLLIIANLCNEQCMNYLVGIYNRYSLNLIPILDRCEVKFKEANLNKIENKPAFMTSLIQEELKELIL